MFTSLPSPSRIVKALFPTTKASASAGAELVTSDGRTLALTAASLRVDARGGIARCVLEQRFENKFDERLHVTYRMPLPADGAVSGYAFVIGERTVRGVVDRKQRARERFEHAIASGHTAGLLEQERADLFTQSLGNIPPGEALTVTIEIDQRLVWLAEGEWELRFPTVIGPRYIGAADTMADVQATHVKVTTEKLPITVSAQIAIGDAITGGRRATSPSHSLTKDANGELSLGGGARLDRDIVVRWPVAAPTAGLALSAARPATGDEAFGLVTIVPPARDVKAAPVPRDLIVLLDTSGSMGGGPLEKAKQVVALMIDSLDERDRFELIEFNYQPTRYLESAEHATPAAKKAAIKWIESRDADGGTEMRAGVIEALKTLRIGAQRQVLIVTDGYVGGENQILRALHERLPASCRLHVLGVGSAVNRSLATALARVGRGAEVIVGTDEDAERGAKRLLDRTKLPMLTNVTISGDALVAQAPEHIPDVFEGAPCVAALMLSTEGGEIIVRGETANGVWEQRTRVQPLRAKEGNQAIVALFGRERVADLEARMMLEPADAAIEEVGLRFQIATRLTSWIAVDESRVVRGPERTQNVPQELPYGTKAQAFGLRGADRDTARSMPAMMQATVGDALADLAEGSSDAYVSGPSFDAMEEEREVVRAPASYSAPPPASYSARPPAPRSVPSPGSYAPSPPRDISELRRSESTESGGGGSDDAGEDFDAITGEVPGLYSKTYAPTPAPAAAPSVPSPEPMVVQAESGPVGDDLVATTKRLASKPSSVRPAEDAKQTVPYEKPPRFVSWLVVALVLALLAALIWWMLS